MESAFSLPQLWHHLGWPLVRLLFYISIGLLVANFIEALNWTRKIAFVARPLTRFAHLSPLTGAAFSMAFFSGVAANTMLSEGFAKGEIRKKELILANLFNSLPTYFLHLPTTFVITRAADQGRSLYLYRSDPWRRAPAHLKCQPDQPFPAGRARDRIRWHTTAWPKK